MAFCAAGRHAPAAQQCARIETTSGASWLRFGCAPVIQDLTNSTSDCRAQRPGFSRMRLSAREGCPPTCPSGDCRGPIYLNDSAASALSGRSHQPAGSAPSRPFLHCADLERENFDPGGRNGFPSRWHHGVSACPSTLPNLALYCMFSTLCATPRVCTAEMRSLHLLRGGELRNCLSARKS